MSLVKCTECGDSKPRIWSGRRDGRNLKVYLERVNGRRWKGLKCPDCAYQTNYAPRDLSSSLGPALNTDPITHRLCRGCKAPLRASRYLNCEDCFNGNLEYRDMAEEYTIHVGSEEHGW